MAGFEESNFLPEPSCPENFYFYSESKKKQISKEKSKEMKEVEMKTHTRTCAHTHTHKCTHAHAHEWIGVKKQVVAAELDFQLVFGSEARSDYRA